jgi:ribonuclease HI
MRSDRHKATIHHKSKPPGSAEIIHIYCDGSGSRPDGKGSGFAWVRPGTGQKQITREDGLTNNQAEYRAILAALESLPKDVKTEIRSDSENTCCQLNGQRRILDPELAALYNRVQKVIQEKKLTVTFLWVPRRQNLAGKLI